MTRKNTSPRTSARKQESASQARWALQDAKAHFSELARRAQGEGPQRVTVHGRDAVVVVSAEAFRRLSGEGYGDQLVAALQASPSRDLDITPARTRMPVRAVKL